MFLPKGRQLAALGREASATVIRDRDDALSSLPGSGYSPSFFHFKPTEASLKRKMHYHSGGTFIVHWMSLIEDIFQQLKLLLPIKVIITGQLFYYITLHLLLLLFTVLGA